METTPNYPNRYELTQSLSEFCHARFVSEFSKRKGIFLTNSSLDEQVDFLSGLFFEHSELESIKNEALGVHSRTTLSGFWLTSETDEYDLISELENHSNEIVDNRLNMKLGPITESDSNNHRGSVGYEQKLPGRLQFLQSTPRNFDFYVTKIGDKKWAIVVDGERSSDGNTMMDWLKRRIPRDTSIVTIDQTELNTKQAVEFFDKLSRKAVHPDWEFTQVKRIAIRKENLVEDNDDEQEEQIDDENQPSALTGISQAILEGNDLRGNSFVKQCENAGYRFTAMTYVYENKEHPYIMEVRAEFKGRPKVFEVALEKYSQRVGLEGNSEALSILPAEKIRILRRYYSEAKYLYDDLVITNPPLR